MQRTPEPELMDDPHQVAAYATADFSGSDNAFVQRLRDLCGQQGLASRPDPLLMDLGCGPGNISERLASAWPDAEVVGVDAAATMLSCARQRAAEARSGVIYRQASMQELAVRGRSALAAPPGGSLHIREADAVVSNSLLHHLHEPLHLWRAIRRLAAPGALVLHRDLRRPASGDAARGLLKRHAIDAPEVLRRDYLASLHAAFTAAEVRNQLEAAGLDGLSVVEVEDRYLEISGRLP